MAPQAKLWGAGRSKQHRCKAISKSLDTSWEALQSGVVGCFLCSSWASQRSLSPLQFALCITTAPCTCIGQIKPHGSELGSACEYPMRGSIPWAVAASSPAVWRLRQLCHLRPRQYRHTDSTSLCHACESSGCTYLGTKLKPFQCQERQEPSGRPGKPCRCLDCLWLLCKGITTVLTQQACM